MTGQIDAGGLEDRHRRVVVGGLDEVVLRATERRIVLGDILPLRVELDRPCLQAYELLAEFGRLEELV